MTASQTPSRVLLSLVFLTGLGTWVGAETDPPLPSGLPSSPPVSDARLLTAEDIDRLLPDSAFNSLADTTMIVNDDPVLTDRGFIHIPAGDFGPTDVGWGGSSDTEFWHESGYVAGHANCTRAVAPVFLPEGVTATLVVLAAEDDSTTSLGLYLSRRAAFADASETMSYIETDSDAPGVLVWIDSTIGQPVIRNGVYQYDLLTYCLTSKKRLRSVFIHYTH